MWWWSTRRGRLTALFLSGALLVYVAYFVWANWCFIGPDLARNWRSIHVRAAHSLSALRG